MSLKINVPKYLQALLSSNKVKNQIQKIEVKTNTVIKENLSNDGSLEIRSDCEEKLEEAKLNLTLLVNQLKRKLPFTHFLSIPFNQPLVQSNFSQFKNQVLEMDHRLTRIDETLFQNPCKIHLTLGIMSLRTDEEKQNAITLLEDCNHTIIKSILEEKPLYLNVKGIDAMNNDLSKVHVVYAKIENPDKLQLTADKVVEKFTENGLMNEKVPVKLHITLMNSIYRMRKSLKRSKSDNYQLDEETKEKECSSKNIKKANKRRRIQRESFDIKDIIKQFDQFVFGENLKLQQLHISSAQELNEKTGYYSALSAIDFPQ